MHTLEFDPQTEHSINQLAIHSGKTPDDLLRDMVINSIKNRTHQSAPGKESQESNASAEWDAFFEKVSCLAAQRKGQDVSGQTMTDITSPRDEIYADRLR